ncbi:29 kDa ribonucleoprotein A, chloroplastic-like [Bidens hawaiensis]|uniref:29 kDa ribonucleoprotein A, chloroplastic-like n=1 Tax=Bidens hawaiensis TaxID=980011 RepID=UPI00404B9A5F
MSLYFEDDANKNDIRGVVVEKERDLSESLISGRNSDINVKNDGLGNDFGRQTSIGQHSKLKLKRREICFHHLLSLTSLTTTSLSNKSPSLVILPSSIKPPKLLSSSSWFVRLATSSFDLYEDEDEEQRQAASYSAELKLYVGNLPWNVDSAALAGLFQRAGNVEMVEVVYDKGSGRSRGFGFVTMSAVKEVEAATRQFNGYELDGRQLRVNSGPPRSKDQSLSRGQRDGGHGGVKGFDSTNKVYVGNLAWSVDNLALETLFQDQGNVMEARVVYDRDSGRSKGFGFVTYGSMEEVNKAIDSLDGLNVDSRSIRVSLAEARQRPQF